MLRTVFFLLTVSSSAAYQPVVSRMAMADGARRNFFSRAGSAGVIALGSPSASWAKLVYFPERSVESVAVRVRKLAVLLDDLQVDIKNEDWDFIVEYPGQFRSYVPAFTKYTDAAYPDATAIDESLRFAMRYEVGKLFGAVEKLKKASAAKDLGKTQAAFADIALAYDRYLKSGNLYEGDAATVSGSAVSDVPAKLQRREGAKKKSAPSDGKSPSSPQRFSKKRSTATKGAEEVPAAAPSPAVEVTYSLDEKPSIGDSVVVYKGPDSGKTGTLLGLSSEGSGKKGAGEASNVGVGTKAIIKTAVVTRGFREIIVIPVEQVAKRTGV
mmetsp:Transcript_53253/g.106823  ORF Transcript_53253/g.106823 Transcript_53253/m.106823 type:complete len:326 (+) Transcript_53253:33-1010(+)